MASHWHVLGAGSIGCLLAGQLSESGCACTLVVKQSDTRYEGGSAGTAFTISAKGKRNQFTLPVSVATDPEPISRLLLTTKAYDACNAFASIAHRLDSDSEVLLLVNGMGIVEQLEQTYPGLKFYCGTTTEGVYRKSSHEFVHAGTGITKFGRHRDKTSPTWFSDWLALSIKCVWDQNIHVALWNKLTVNCAINPLTALYRCTNGELLSRDSIAQDLVALCAEIAAISTAAGQPIGQATLHQSVTEVITGTSANRSSMLQDILAKRRTEIEPICGYLLEVARKNGAAAPITEELVSRIREIDSRNSTGLAAAE